RGRPPSPKARAAVAARTVRPEAGLRPAIRPSAMRSARRAGPWHVRVHPRKAPRTDDSTPRSGDGASSLGAGLDPLRVPVRDQIQRNAVLEVRLEPGQDQGEPLGRVYG